MKNKKLLSLMLAGSLLIGATGTTVKASKLDDLYKAAYDSMIVAQNERTQVAINKARVAINALPVDMVSARGTFSSAVDKVQQPIFVKIVDLIMDARKIPSQSKINQGRDLLVGVEPFYANSWSSALDGVQQTLMKNAMDEVDSVVANYTESKKASAKAKLDELDTAKNTDVKNFSKNLRDRLEKAKPNTPIVVKNAPVITAKDLALKVGDIWMESLHNTTATDVEDGDLTSKIKVTSSFIMTDGGILTTVGNYYIDFEVTDKDGNKTTKRANITVTPAPGKPNICADNPQMNVGEVWNMSLHRPTAIDFEDGDITSKIKVKSHNIPLDSNGKVTKSGVYNVTFEVTDKDGNTETKTCEVYVM